MADETVTEIISQDQPSESRANYPYEKIFLCQSFLGKTSQGQMTAALRMSMITFSLQSFVSKRFFFFLLMPILFGQIHSEIKISFHGALRKLTRKKTGGVSNRKTKRRA